MAHAELAAGGSIEAMVLDTISATCRCERGALAADSSLLDLNLDSLTLIAILTRIEAASGVTFDGDDAVQLLGIRDVGELCRAIARKIEQERYLDENGEYRACGAGERCD